MDQHAVPQPAGDGAGEWKALEGFCDRAIGPARLPLYVLALEPLLRRLRDERTRPALRGITLTGNVRAKISAFADDITVFVSCRLDIVAMKMAVERYEKVAGAMINFDKSEGLRLGAWREVRPPARAFPHPLDVVRSRPPPGAKLVGSTGLGRSAGGCLASKEVVLKGQGGGVRRVHLPLDPLPFVHTPSA